MGRASSPTFSTLTSSAVDGAWWLLVFRRSATFDLVS